MSANRSRIVQSQQTFMHAYSRLPCLPNRESLPPYDIDHLRDGLGALVLLWFVAVQAIPRKAKKEREK